MVTFDHARRITAIVVACGVILCASGQLFNWHPIGVGAMVRSGLSLVGIAGAVLLLFQRRLAWLFLLPWALLQIWVVVTDPGGPWFHQSLHAGWQTFRTGHSGPRLLVYEGSGVNFVGLIWLALFLAMLVFRLVPPLKPMPSALRLTPRRALIVGLILAPLIAWQGYLAIERYRAPLVISANYPGTKVYYRDQFLGRTPLAVTPRRIERWGLPLNRGHPLELRHTHWTQRLWLYTSDRESVVVLDLVAPFYARSPKTLPTPWGVRHTSIGIRDSADQRHDLMLIAPYDRIDATYPSLRIELLQPPPYAPGETVPLRLVLSNPARSFTGFDPYFQVMFFPFESKRATAAVPPSDHSRQRFDLPEDWNEWTPGDRRERTLDMVMPDAPGQYTLMAIFSLVQASNSNRLAIGSPYSNYKLVEIVEPASGSKAPGQRAAPDASD